MSEERFTERDQFYCEHINDYAKVKAIYTKPLPDSDSKVLVNASCDDNILCPIMERKGNSTNPNYRKCLYYLYLKESGIAK